MAQWKRWVLGAAITLAASAAQAGSYSRLYVFGDSLSDVGNDFVITGGAIPSAAYYTDGSTGGRFTNGVNYVDRLAAALGLDILPSVIGGTGYAYGGARTTYVPPGLEPFGALSFNQQLAAYQTAHPAADPAALYVLWIGANDMADALGAAAGGDLSAVPAAITVAVEGIGVGIEQLAARGARHFLVLNLPNLALTPLVRELGDPLATTLARNASRKFNETLAARLASPALAGLDVRTVNAWAAQTLMTQAPDRFGFENVTTACYTGEVDGQPRAGAPLSVCAAPDTYMYWDYEHPTAALHAKLATLAIRAAKKPPPPPGR